MFSILLFEIPESGCSTAGCKYPNCAKYFCKKTNTLLQSNTYKVLHSIKITFSWDMAPYSLVQRYLPARPLRIEVSWDVMLCC